MVVLLLKCMLMGLCRQSFHSYIFIISAKKMLFTVIFRVLHSSYSYPVSPHTGAILCFLAKGVCVCAYLQLNVAVGESWL